MCGDWTHDERARYLKALVANALGEPAVAKQHADDALAIIAANSPRPIDQTFLTLARANARRRLGDDGWRDDLAASDADAAGWDDDGLVQWHAEERARAFPDLPPRQVAEA